MGKPDYAALKKGGFMKQVQKNHFSMRLRTVGGQITAEQLKMVYDIANEYGQGYIHLTSRQGIEIPFIKLDDVDEVKEKLEQAALEPGACGPRVRTVTACQGSTICPSGLIDTTSLAQELDKRYFGKDLPHKFKIGITGCRNNCLKAEENDLGIKGGMSVVWNKSKCSYCGLCEALCPAKAIIINKGRQELDFTENLCIYCGKCAKSCPLEAWEGREGYVLSFGGLFGNRIEIGKQLLPLIYSQNALIKIIDNTLVFFSKYGKGGERFRNTVERIGWNTFEKELKFNGEERS